MVSRWQLVCDGENVMVSVLESICDGHYVMVNIRWSYYDSQNVVFNLSLLACREKMAVNVCGTDCKCCVGLCNKMLLTRDTKSARYSALLIIMWQLFKYCTLHLVFS